MLYIVVMLLSDVQMDIESFAVNRSYETGFFFGMNLICGQLLFLMTNCIVASLLSEQSLIINKNWSSARIYIVSVKRQASKLCLYDSKIFFSAVEIVSVNLIQLKSLFSTILFEFTWLSVLPFLFQQLVHFYSYSYLLC